MFEKSMSSYKVVLYIKVLEAANQIVKILNTIHIHGNTLLIAY